MIKASVYGRLGQDPTVRDTQSGKQFTTTSVAADATQPGKDQEAIWFQVAAFGRAGEDLARLEKGDLCSLTGTIHKTRYTSRDGDEREILNITAEAVVGGRSVRPRSGQKKSEPAEQQPASEPDDTWWEEPGPDAPAVTGHLDEETPL